MARQEDRVLGGSSNREKEFNFGKDSLVFNVDRLRDIQVDSSFGLLQ